MMKNNCITELSLTFIIVALIIHLYGFILFKSDDNINDPLQNEIYGISLWTITHFIFFAYIGYYYEDCFKESMLLGILWELYEASFGKFFPILFPKIAREIDPNWNSWTYGCYQDIIFNFLGFQFGKLLKKMIL